MTGDTPPGDACALDGFDSGVLAGLAAVLGETRMRRLLEITRAEFGEALTRVQAAVADGNIRLALDEAHATRGAAGNVGATRVAAAIEQLETVLRAGGSPAPALAAVTAAVSAARGAIDAQMAARAAP
jgi:HPt (histidine-containing phosphotransfer) domain-containing protein